jgi:multisubunit Na+/H+ antiporter MnhC subunit
MMSSLAKLLRAENMCLYICVVGVFLAEDRGMYELVFGIGCLAMSALLTIVRLLREIRDEP